MQKWELIRAQDLARLRRHAALFDVALIALVITLALYGPPFLGGFGWFLLLGLSPRAWSRS